MKPLTAAIIGALVNVRGFYSSIGRGALCPHVYISMASGPRQGSVALPNIGVIHSRCKPPRLKGIIRARSKSTLARPYIARLSVFNLLICPSVCPLLQGSSTALRTASISCRNVLAKRRMP